MNGTWIEILRTGVFRDRHGREVRITSSDLDKAVAGNDCVEHTLPFVIGHPSIDAPAYGWAGALKREGDRLLCQAKDVVEEFAAGVAKRMWPNRSIRFDPATMKIRHVGFLGAAAPAVEGLATIQFAEGEEESVEVDLAASDADDEQTTMPRGIRDAIHRVFDWLAGEGNEAQTTHDLRSTQQEESAMGTTNGSVSNIPPANEAETTGSDLSALERRTTDLETSNRELEERLRKSDEEKAALRERVELAEFSAWLDTDEMTEKVPPALRSGAIELFRYMRRGPETFEFASSETTDPTTFLKNWLTSFPKLIELGADPRLAERTEMEVTADDEYAKEGDAIAGA